MGKTRKKASDGNARSTPQTKAPVLPALCPKSLTREAILGSEIFIARNVLSPKECGQLIEYAESLGFLHQGSRGAAHQEALRDNDRISFHDESFAQQLWKRIGISDLFRGIDFQGRHAIGLNPHIRFYRYSKGQKFGRHIDESVTVDGATTQYTLLIYLSGGRPLQLSKNGMSATEVLVGGETVFYGAAFSTRILCTDAIFGEGRKNRVIATIAPEAGMALLHIHGDQCHEHEGAQATGNFYWLS